MPSRKTTKHHHHEQSRNYKSDRNKNNNRRPNNNGKRKERNLLSKFNLTRYVISDFKNLVLRVPIEFGLFGGLKKRHLELIQKIITKNNMYLKVFEPWESMSPKLSKLHKKIIKTFVNRKNAKTKSDNIVDNHELLTVYKDKLRKQYFLFIHLETAFKETCKRAIFDKQKINYIELRTHFYDTDNKKKTYKYPLVDFYNVETDVSIKSIDNSIYYPVYDEKIKEGNIAKTSCIYRICWEEDENTVLNKNWTTSLDDIKDNRSMNKIKNNNIWNYNHYFKTCYLYLIPNFIRYKTRFNK